MIDHDHDESRAEWGGPDGPELSDPTVLTNATEEVLRSDLAILEERAAKQWTLVRQGVEMTVYIGPDGGLEWTRAIAEEADLFAWMIRGELARRGLC